MSLKVAITGGAGFVGSHLAEELIKQNYQVVIIDDFSTSNKPDMEHLVVNSLTRPSRKNNIPSHSPIQEKGNETEQVQLFEESIADISLLQIALQGVDYVFHMAAIPSVTKSIEDPLTSHSINATGTLNVLIAARDNKVKKVIYASSASVYGNTQEVPILEETTPNPQSLYAITKLTGEYYCQAFTQIYGLDTICLRFFNVYGPGQNPNSQYAAVIPRFINMSLHEKSPIIYGDGCQTRDFVFVNDAVTAVILAAKSNTTGIFNIGTGNKTTIIDLTKLIIELTDKHLKPVYQRPRLGDIKHSLADISKARSFGYAPQHNLKEGLEKTIQRFENCRVINSGY